MSYAGKHRERPLQRHPLLRAVAISTVVVLLAVLGGGYLVYRHLDSNITSNHAFDLIGSRPQQVTTETRHKPLNVLVLGSDSRAGQDDVLGSTPGLSDTTILLHLSGDRKRAYGISIPRDLMVERPDCVGRDGETVEPGGLSMFNAAYAIGGAACTIKTVEAMTDVRVDHFVVVSFTGFKEMVDALGGVPVCVPKPVNDDIGRIYLPAGEYDVTGQQALDYVRVRHVLSENGDIGRMRRQQAFLAAMVNKVVSAGTLANPVRLFNFLDAATKSLTTDPGLSSISRLAGLGKQVQDIGLNKIEFFTVPITPYAPDPNRLALAPSAERLFSQLRRDQPLDRTLTGNAAKASQGKPGESGKKSPEKVADAQANGLCA